MGNSPHELQGWNVRYVQNIDDKYFGNIDIYQNEERAYISMVRRTFAKNGDDRMLNDFLKTLDFVEQDINHKNKFIVPVLHKKLKECIHLLIQKTNFASSTTSMKSTASTSTLPSSIWSNTKKQWIFKNYGFAFSGSYNYPSKSERQASW